MEPEQLQELNEAYQKRLEIAVGALIHYSEQEGGEVAKKALEAIKNADGDIANPVQVASYKFIKMEGRHSRYEITDKETGLTWSVLFDPKERGDLLNSVKKRAAELRALHDQSASSSS